MKISYNWLKQYINLDMDYKQVAEILTNIGLEVEGIEMYESVPGGLEGVVIGEVKTCKRHPNADKLSVTTVDIGREEVLHIVCGAPNVSAGQKVPVATVGTTVYKGEDRLEIKRSKIRGEISEGMICAEDELGIGDSHEGIMVLDPSAKTGTPGSEYFHIEKDIVFEIGLTPNRIDSASHYGVARDLAAYLKQHGQIHLKRPSVDEFAIDNHNRHIDVVVENTQACPRYTGITITGITVSPSPEWLQHRLKAIGLTPINNIVDITNFVLQETGQPLHAFDADKIKGDKVVVQTLPEHTPFITLDEEERKLTAHDLMICNTEGGMCMAGVFGGIHSGVTDATQHIFLESAHFNPVYIRKTSKHHMLNTDASFRFERGSDPNITVYALKRAAMLIKELAGGSISSEIVDVYPEPVKKCELSISFTNIDRLIGKKIEHARIKGILEALDIQVIKESTEEIQVRVPTYRVDVKREADVIEEILRIYGYNNVEFSEKVNATLSYIRKPDRHQMQNMLSDFLTSNGYFEIMSNSLTHSIYYSEGKKYGDKSTIRLYNPLSQDLDAMRQTLLYNGLEAIQHNTNRQYPNLKFFEMGNVYSVDASKNGSDPLKKYHEEQHLGIFITGDRYPERWNVQTEKTGFFDIKTMVETVLTRLGLDLIAIEKSGIQDDVFSDGLAYQQNGKVLAEFGAVKKSLLKPFDVKNEVYFAEIHWYRLLELVQKKSIVFEELPRFPEVRRDLALLLDTNVSFARVQELAFNTERKYLKNVDLFDVFEDQKLGEGKKSYAVRFILQDKEKTLTDKQIDKIMQRLVNVYKEELGATLRA